MSQKRKSPSSGLTGQQKRVLNYIGAFAGSEGRAPSLEEIRDHLGLSAVSTVHEHVGRLVEKGYLSRQWNRPRSIEMAEPLGRRRWARLVPLVGRVVAGRPLQELRVGEEIAVPATLVEGTGDFAVTVGDDSFAEHGVLTDDTLVIAGGADSVRTGGLVLAVVGDEVFLRRFSGLDVAASTSSVDPSETGSKIVRVLGGVSGLLRKYR
jgi:repressor LexA